MTIYHPDLVNLYGCAIGRETKIGAFVEIQKNAIVGAKCHLGPYSLICEGVTIEDEVFLGPGVIFLNDKYPRATVESGAPQTEADWELLRTRVKKRASIGAHVTVLGGVTIGRQSMVGAGSVVTHDVPDCAKVVGVPARVVGDVRD